MSMYDVNPNELVEKVAVKLKDVKEIKAPEWSDFVKTGHFKQRFPARTDWWHVRSAAVLRSVAKLGPIGTSKLRTKYGGKKNRGVATEKQFKASGSIIRNILKQLEKAELIKQTQKGVHKGRVVTPKGQAILDRASLDIYRPVKKEKPAKQEKPAAEKKEKAARVKKPKAEKAEKVEKAE